MSKLSYQNALSWIIGSTLVVSGSAYLLLKKLNKSEDQTPLSVIVQTGPQREALQTAYLSQLLGLSADHPLKTGAFDSKKAVSLLQKSPIIKEAKVRILRPGAVYVDYTVRQPIALLADYENTALDSEGRAFPLSPFFPPKNLPEIYLGLQGELDWNASVKGKSFDLACEILRLLQSPQIPKLFFVRRIDVSRAEEKSLGKREIVLVAEEVVASKEGRWIFPRYIRLSPKDYSQALGNYLNLREKLILEESKNLPPMHQGQTLLYQPLKTIDLRLPKMGFVN